MAASAFGGSYEGYTAVMSLVNPSGAEGRRCGSHRWSTAGWATTGSTAARSASSARSSHYDQEAARKGDHKWWLGEYDAYGVPASGFGGALAKTRGLDQLGFWRALAEHTSYDWWWQAQAVDKVLAKEPITVPTMIVSERSTRRTSTAVLHCSRRSRRDPRGEVVHLVLGLGITAKVGAKVAGVAIQFEGDTAGWFRRTVMQPFLDRYARRTRRGPRRRGCWSTRPARTGGASTITGRRCCADGCKNRARCICWPAASSVSARRRP